MSGRGGIYKGPGGEDLHGDGRPVGKPHSMFPMIDGPPIEWGEAEEVYQLYTCLFGNQQSLQRIAQRGGFGYEEIKRIREKHDHRKAEGQCRCPS